MQSFLVRSANGAGTELPGLRPPPEAPRGSSRHELERQLDLLAGELDEQRRARDEERSENTRLAERMARLLEVLPAGVVVLDGRGRVSECNAAASVLLGERLRRGCLWRELVATVFAPRPDDGPEVSLRNGRRVSISTRSLGTEPGQIVLLTDVTESRELREALGRMQRRAAVGNLAATLAHQIRTPLATALLYASGLRDERLDDADRGQAGERIVERLRHLERLVGDMLQFSRQGSFELGQTTVGALLDEACRGRAAAVSGFSCACDDALRARPLSANLPALASAIDNLIGNAFDAGAGRVEVRVEEAGADGCRAGGVRLVVRDDGPGMSPEVRRQAFEPFFTTRGRGRGTGLGLAIARAVIEAHAGDIDLDTGQGEGCRFVIELPAA